MSFRLTQENIKRAVSRYMPTENYRYEDTKVRKLANGGSTPARVILYYKRGTTDIVKISLLSYETEVVTVIPVINDKYCVLHCYNAESHTTRKHIKLFIQEYLSGVDYKTVVGIADRYCIRPLLVKLNDEVNLYE